jgi:ATP-dependent DNA ligase
MTDSDSRRGLCCNSSRKVPASIYEEQEWIVVRETAHLTCTTVKHGLTVQIRLSFVHPALAPTTSNMRPLRMDTAQLTLVRQPFDHHDFLFELKHDGFQALAHIWDGKCELVSRKRSLYKSFQGLRDKSD